MFAVAMVAIGASAAELRVPGAVAPPAEPTKPVARRGPAHAIDTALDIALAPPDDETKARLASKRGGPLRIGVHRAVPAAFQDDLLARLHWTRLPGGAAVGVVTVTSPGAESIRVSMRAQLPADAELRFFRPRDEGANAVVDAVFTQADFFAAPAAKAPSAAEGKARQSGKPSTRRESPASGPKSAPLLWSPSVAGDVIGIEITLPASTGPKGAWLRVEKVAHRFKRVKSHQGLDCDNHIDVACRADAIPAGLQDAVARIEYESAGVSALCTGTLLNDVDTDTTVNYLLTANHCIATPEAASTLQATWFYQRETCGSNAVDVGWTRTAGGADLLATEARQDATLLRLRRRPAPNVYYAGWDAAPAAVDDAVQGVHHPGGDVKKYSAGPVLGVTDSQDLRAAIEVTWDEGVTEGGSSGSGLFRDGLLIGTLSHGDACDAEDYRDYYGSFAEFFPRICTYLNGGEGCGDGHQDIPEHAAVLDVNGETGNNAIEAALSDAGDVDYWRIAVPSFGLLVVETSGTTDTVGLLEDDAGAALAADDDGGEGVNFRIARFVPAGTYYIRVGAAGEAGGDYTVRATHTPIADAPLAELALNARREDAVTAAGETDQWRLEIPERGFVLLHTSGGLDTVGTLRDAAGNLLASHDDISATFRQFRITALLAAGTYFLEVRGYGEATGAYDLWTAYTALSDLPVVSEAGATATIERPGEMQFWRLDVDALGVSAIETTGATDTVGALLTAAGEVAASVDDQSSDNVNFGIERVLASGTHYVRVHAYGRSTGEYTLSATHNPLAEDAISDLGAAGGGSGTLADAEDADWWRLRTTASGFATVETGGEVDTFGELDDGAGRRHTDDNSGARRNFAIGAHLEAGTYFVRVSGVDEAVGDYTLHLRQEGPDGADTAASAVALALEANAAASVAPAGDVDYWRVEVPSLGELVAETTGTTDTLGTLEDAAGHRLARNDDDGAGANFRIAQAVPPGVYYIRVGGYRRSVGAYTLRVSHTRDALRLPLFLAASLGRQGFVRLANRSDRAGSVSMYAIDDAGERRGPVELQLAALQTLHFNSNDLEDGNAAKGIATGIGQGSGDWRLELNSALDLNALAYVRTSSGFLTNMHDRVGAVVGSDQRYVVPIFNPASNTNQVSKLRLVNPAEAPAMVAISGFDDRGHSSEEVRFTIAAGATRTISAQSLEAGAEELAGALGDGRGKWQLNVGASHAITVLNLLESPGADSASAGNLTNLSTATSGVGARACPAGGCEVPLFVAADDPVRQGFVRISNHSPYAGAVTLHAIDDAGRRFGPVTIELGASEVVHFNSDDLEGGNDAKGLSAGVGDGDGDWRLLVETDLDIVGPLAYVRTTDGFLTAMHDIVRARSDSQDGETGARHVVPIFNPASNRNQVSQLRIVNPNADAVEITISATDDNGDPAPGGDVRLTLPAGQARRVTAQQLEAGDDALAGSFGDGSGKWRLVVRADQPLRVMNLLQSRTGNLTNLSSSPQG